MDLDHREAGPAALRVGLLEVLLQGREGGVEAVLEHGRAWAVLLIGGPRRGRRERGKIER